jgi:transmembrane sensor
VAKNPARPFLVEAGAIAVRAIGTAFNVRLGASDVEVLVTEGRVVVGSEVERSFSHPPLPPSQPAVPEGQRAPGVFLAVNQRALISTARPASAAVPVAPIVEEVAPDAVREALAWQGPRLVFVDTPLVDAIAQFNRRNPVQLVLADPELEAVLIGGSFRAQNVDAFVRLLASGNDIVTERPDPLRIVLRKAK